jgi:(heptosyl)LPS beta-1,4-glucosyltransferase
LSKGTKPIHSPINLNLIAIILTYNEEEHIVACIKSLAWADSVLVWDSFSTDKTLELAQAAGAKIGQAVFENYAQQRNAALDSLEGSGCDWVFFVDADERATDDLAKEIRGVIDNRPENGWFVPRHNYIFGNLTLGAGWFPDYQARLFKYGKVRYERPVHEVALVDGERGWLETPLVHYNYKDIEQFHRTQEKYTLYEAGILKQEGIRPKFYTPFTQPIRHFWWRYKTLGGYKDGLHGLRLSLLMGYYEWVKYKNLK